MVRKHRHSNRHRGGEGRTVPYSRQHNVYVHVVEIYRD